MGEDYAVAKWAIKKIDEKSLMWAPVYLTILLAYCIAVLFVVLIVFPALWIKEKIL
jgi:hypothetical protein